MYSLFSFFFFFFFNDTATTEIYTLSLHDALPISCRGSTGRRPRASRWPVARRLPGQATGKREIGKHTSELQSHVNLVCRLLLEKKKKKHRTTNLIKTIEHIDKQNKNT